MCQLHIDWKDIAMAAIISAPVTIPWAMGCFVILKKLGELLSCLL